MEYRNLGKSGLKVSAIGLGCNNFGMKCDLEQTRAIVHRALDEGVTFFDTADIYGNRGGSEEMLGKALGQRRREVIVASKFGMLMGDGPYLHGASRRYVLAAAEESLRRLNTDYIDLYQIHTPDPETPQEETLEALADLVRAGKVRYIGCSNFAAWQLAEALGISRARGLPAYVSAQNEYSLIVRNIESELLPACRHFGVGILPYFPLASGFLTGKYRRGAELPGGSRMALMERLARRNLTEANFDSLEKLERFARERGHTILELAVAWLVSEPQNSSVICGATTPEQVSENIRAGNWRLSAEEREGVDKVMQQ
ncbi:MAG TPA: aldo/keto reductase [Candidatus Binataceae bacterium]|nr:aldo/keto reductase [Candidatus Binataceae bacterium]